MRMRRIVLSLQLAAILCFAFSSAAHAGAVVKNELTIQSSVLGDRTSVGKMINNRAYVDLIGLLNCLPFLVNSKGISWEPGTKTLSIYPDLGDESNHLKFQSGEDYFIAQGEKVELGSNIVLVEGKMYIPLKAVADYYKLAIVWDKKSNTVTVSGVEEQ